MREGIDTGYSMLKQDGATPPARLCRCSSDMEVVNGCRFDSGAEQFGSERLPRTQCDVSLVTAISHSVR